MVKVQKLKDQSPFVLIGHYSQPGKKAIMDAELSHVISLVRRRYQDIQVVITGDLNRTPAQALNLAQRHHLKLSQTTEDTLITHHNAANPARNN